ncbi:ISNCY family transposase [Bradyrhizobium sp. KBS0727]|uniref:ISNCY family transposase n=1 Tax=unclassified Bradyrhizobium TaxID=2631580 RepID=UPI00110D8E7C|nr:MULTISPECIES: ISNCY family transposase [unclassified Bradyrhizobium]QDW38871.1 ISNCY family transposase [Bradyrhizobium sp. KBS0725]QDW41216.1 ISNCY family transposase [Bradyrhizobium sp. KBS0725]QDW45474.1 ISNCY family transposase [Bradyrhizobium sp. KBS0727]QDW47822.1 ISNCY family transposase [Bradyrhizobium sp. KBS0727]
MTVIAMSRTEIDRMSVLQDLAASRIKVADAATLMGVGRRQVFRLGKAFARHGPEALVSRRRGRPSNRSYPSGWRAKVLGIIRERYPDFGPTLAAEKLAELHGIHLGRETLRQWMIAAGLWKDRRARLKAVHQPRYRRDCCGELIQIDGSEHWWFEGRGPQCTLLVYIDDATSRLMHLQFVESENTFDYFAATRAYLERYGKPVAFYSDKHGVFRVNKKDAVRGDGMTQFGRALHALNIDIICANSSQAKGRVERANGTLQDRLVKEMRLSGIDTIEAGNAFLPAFMEKYNARFGKAPLEDRDLHRPLASHEDIDDAFAWKEERSVSVNLTLQYDQVLFILEPTKIARSLARKRVTVIDYPDGRLAIRYNGVDLPYRTFDKRPQVNQAALVENKRLGPILAYIAEQQKELDMSRSAKAPRRRGQKNHMFKVG